MVRVKVQVRVSRSLAENAVTKRMFTIYISRLTVLSKFPSAQNNERKSTETEEPDAQDGKRERTLLTGRQRGRRGVKGR